MPDTGLWTLRCQQCNATFVIELTAGQRVLDAARSHTCPSCKKRPESVTGDPDVGAWHTVIGFNATRPNRSRL